MNTYDKIVGEAPTIGRIVHYRLRAVDAQQINKRRADARRNMDQHRENSNGVQVHVGNEVAEGDVYPMVITRVWGDQADSYVNGQIFLDGNDLFWTTSTRVGKDSGTWSWPCRK